MNNSLVSYVGWLLLFAALGFYGYGIYTAISLSWSPITSTSNLPYHDVLSTTIGSIQALLLTNLGILLGISVANPSSPVAQALKLGSGTNVNMAPLPPMQLKEKIQLFALVLYVCSLIACFVTWAVNKFSSDPKDVVPVIPETGRLFIGVVLAYLTAALK